MYARPPLDLVYQQSTGYLYLADVEDRRCFLGRGYSGIGEDRDNPASEEKCGRGPIPRGVWRIGPPVQHPRLGPCAFRLRPFGHEAHNRTEFFIHGDNRSGKFTASTGCIVLDRYARECIRALGLKDLMVIE